MPKVVVHVTDSLKREWVTAARKAGITLSEWVVSMASVGSGIHSRRGKKNIELIELDKPEGIIIEAMNTAMDKDIEQLHNICKGKP